MFFCHRTSIVANGDVSFGNDEVEVLFNISALKTTVPSVEAWSGTCKDNSFVLAFF